MKVLSLKQPWASLVAIGAKKWETRSWKPSPAMHYILQHDGILIHSSAKIGKMEAGLMTFPPFAQHRDEIGAFPLGKIVCWVRVGRIIPTTQWLEDNQPDIYAINTEEREFGNYESGRWAWELTELVKFDNPIPAKGALSLWDYYEQLSPELLTRACTF